MSRKPKCACEGTTLDRLLQPTAMALLFDGPLHGYVLVERLQISPLLKGNPPDPSGVYRLLNTLENQGLVSFTWKQSTEGPSKRLYKLTAEGKRCVYCWIDTLEKFEEDIGRLLVILRKQVGAD